MAIIKLTGFNTATGRSSTASDTDTVDLAGSLTIGNSVDDAVIFNAEIDSDFIPDDDTTYDLGSATKQWASVHTADITSSGVATFEGTVLDKKGSEIVGGIFQLDDGLIQNPNSSYSKIYFPADDTLGETVAPSSVNYKIAMYDGNLVKVQVKSTTNFTGKTLTIGLHTATGTANAYSSTASASVSVSGAEPNTVYTFNFADVSGISFNEGDIFGFSLGLSENWAGNENIHFTSVVKYNP
jgi:hypothetical protein